MLEPRPSKGFLTPEIREQIRSRVPIEDLLRDYDVHLIPAGRRFKALCPFHQEKTPSFSVDVEKQFYHCFGCEAGGDIFKFVQEYDRVTFPEAAETLARRAGVVLETRPGAFRQQGETLGLYEVLDFAAEFYRQALVRHPQAEFARKYIDSRGISREMQQRFRIGVSLPEWDALLRAANAKGFSTDTLARAGLVRERQPQAGRPGGGHYDYFRNRLMFPIEDIRGRVIGFGARTLGDDQPKYLNTPKTPLFDKSRVLYGLGQARVGIRREGAIAIVEGYTDAIALHQEGVDFAVASLGTAFTRENAQAMRRQAPRIFVIFDGDAAGQGAAERSLDLLVGEDLEVRVYSVTNGKDPCDAVLELGGDEFRQRLVRDAIDLFEFKWRSTVAAPEAQGSPQARANAVDSFLRLVAGVKNEVARRLVLRDYAERLGLRDSDLERALSRAVRSVDQERQQQAAFQSRKPLGDSGGQFHGAAPGVGSGGFSSGAPNGGGPGERAGTQAGGGPNSTAPLDPLAEIVLECLMALPDRAALMWEQVPEAIFTSSITGAALRGAVVEELRFASERGGRFDGGEMAKRVDGPASRVLYKLLQRLHDGDDTVGADVTARYSVLWESCQRDIHRFDIQTRIARLEREKLQLEQSCGKKACMKVQQEIFMLKKELKKAR